MHVGQHSLVHPKINLLHDRKRTEGEEGKQHSFLVVLVLSCLSTKWPALGQALYGDAPWDRCNSRGASFATS